MRNMRRNALKKNSEKAFTCSLNAGVCGLCRLVCFLYLWEMADFAMFDTDDYDDIFLT